MTRTILRRVAALGSSVAFGLLAVGCGALDVSDPTAVEESELNDAAGAQLLRAAALKQLARAVVGVAFTGGLFTDELLFELPSFAAPGTSREEALDRRESVRYEQLDSFGGLYSDWQELRQDVAVALPKLRDFGLPSAAEAHIGEMLAVRAFATLRLAEDFCPGFPLHEIVDGTPIIGQPLSTEHVLERALVDFDSAAVYAADSARILNFARVGRARTLLGLGRFADAAAAVTDVPSDYVYQTEYSPAVGRFTVANTLSSAYFVWRFVRDRSVADGEGGAGLDFVSAGDPRVETTQLGTAADGTGLYGIDKYPTESTPIVVASGVEARLIEAEAALQEGGDWLGILNALRTTCTDASTCPDPAPAGGGGVEGLPPLTDPGTAVGRQDLLFRERAFWLFATGHRLADLRRLVRLYGRDAESVFPTGAYRLGGVYGAGTSIPFPGERESSFNPAVTGCTSR